MLCKDEVLLRAGAFLRLTCRIALDRKHAQIAVDDTEVAAAFRAECRATWDDGWCVLQPHPQHELRSYLGTCAC